MLYRFFHTMGLAAIPLLMLSVVIVGMVFAYALAILRRQLPRGHRPWARTVEPLAGVATAIGLAGTIIGVASAFGSMGGNFDAGALLPLFSEAYTCTAGGVGVSLLAMVGCYGLDNFARR